MGLRVESRAHVVLERWMVSELKLHGNKLVVYAIIYGCSLAGNQEFTASINYFCEWLDLDRKQVLSILKELERSGLILRKSKVVEGITYNSYRAQIPDGEPLDPLEDALPEPVIPEDEKIPFKEIIDYLNKRLNSSFEYTTKATRKHIRARWEDGFRLDDFYLVIEGRLRAWRYDKEMKDYIRPQTLFGTKFESYLQAAKRDKINPVFDGEGKEDQVLDAEGKPKEY